MGNLASEVEALSVTGNFLSAQSLSTLLFSQTCARRTEKVKSKDFSDRSNHFVLITAEKQN